MLHKKCAEVLRLMYIDIQNNKDITPLIKKYEQHTASMQLEPLSFTLKPISDRYHWHLNEAFILLKEHNLLPHIRRGDREPKEDFGPCAIYLDNLRSAYNIGSILRTTEALRIGSVHFAGNTPLVENTKVQKTSMGADKLVPCFAKANLQKLPRPFIALETAVNAQPISSFVFPKVFTLILGNEEYGISDPVLEQVDSFVDIPLFGMKNSINVACAYAICAQEIRRQRS